MYKYLYLSSPKVILREFFFTKIQLKNQEIQEKVKIWLLELQSKKIIEYKEINFEEVISEANIFKNAK